MVHKAWLAVMLLTQCSHLARSEVGINATCADIGCGVYNKSNPCECNFKCGKYHDCCADFNSTCGGPQPGPSPSPSSDRRRSPSPSPGPPGPHRPYDAPCVNPKGPPAGPEQMHLALGNSPDEMSLTFATSKNFTQVQCTVEGAGTFTGKARTYTDGGWDGLLHTVVFLGLKPDTNYSYFCGTSQPITHFRTAPTVGTLPVRIAAVADLGEDCNHDGCGNATINRLNEEAKKGSYSLLLHAGDIAYTGGEACIWDNFFQQLQDTTARVPYMVAPGNHESHYNFSAYRSRFSMPGDAVQNENLWYSFDYGGVHVTSYSTEHDLELQVDWLRGDLQKAASNRAQVPWIVVMAHKPLYCSTNDYYDCQVGCLKIANVVEQILKDASVDLYLAGHLHNYERTWPVFQGKVAAQSYTNPAAPVHIVIGMAGDDEGLTDKWETAQSWTANKAAKLGYAMLNFQSPTTMQFEYVLSETGEVADNFTIVKSGTWVV